MSDASATARAEILQRIRSALSDAPAIPAPLAVERPPREADVGLFVERVADYRATVTPCGPSDDEVRDAIAAAFARHGARAIAVPHDLPAAWRPADLMYYEDPADPRALGVLDGVLTASALGIAETGTIVLNGGPGQGARQLTLLPDLHVCVVDASTIVAGVAEATPLMHAAVARGGRPLTLISGPSATSDIELDRVEGVHGPRRLEVVVRQEAELGV
ncbi:LutC/YkgG family protein [Baekduia sp. Peel2402]|uniref:LutC/YkgG family protein n=1 Tax=Baekduia sp. Peel2402 TaxID=3458296 RepID=UPI00403E3C5E